jgi:hypothetical protein
MPPDLLDSGSSRMLLYSFIESSIVHFQLIGKGRLMHAGRREL